MNETYNHIGGQLVSAYQSTPTHPSKGVMTIHNDGRITVAEDAAPTETAKQVLECLQGEIQHMLRVQREADEALMRECLQLLGPEAPECSGCAHEWETAIKLLTKRLEQP